MAFSPAFFLLGVPGTVFGFLASDGDPTVITSDDTLDVDPGDTAVVTVTATGTGTMTFSIIPGGGAYGFQINSSSGALSFKNPAGVGVSTVTVKAESVWGSDTQTITVTVGAGYHTDAVHFDGSAWLTNASLSCADSTAFSMSFWFKPASAISGFQTLWVVDPVGSYVTYCGTDVPATIHTHLADADGSNEIDAETTPDNLVTAAWHHFLMSADLNHPTDEKVVAMYLDDVDVTAFDDNSGGAFSVIMNALPFLFGGDGVGNFDDFIGDIADPWIAPAQSLLTGSAITEATRRKFISAIGKPVDLGADGSTPTGTAPAIFFSGPAASFATNLGTGGAFTPTGVITDAATSPSD